MNIIFIGTGSAFCLKNYHSNAIIEKNGKRLLFDAGGDLRFALAEQNLSFKDLDAVYISHLHNDHIGGIEYLAMESYFSNPKQKIRLITQKSMADDLWSSSLKGGLSVISTGSLVMEDYFEMDVIEKSFVWENTEFTLVETVHSTNKLEDHPVFGLVFVSETGVKFFITGDTRFFPEILDKDYWKADIIIQDTETAINKSPIHAHFDELLTLPKEIKRKMYLWHYQDNVVDDFNYWQELSLKNGFKGLLKKGDIITF